MAIERPKGNVTKRYQILRRNRQTDLRYRQPDSSSFLRRPSPTKNTKEKPKE